MISRCLLTVVLLACACGSPANTQFLPIGSGCTANDQCGTSPFICNATLPRGYCERPCATESDCPTDATCVGTACRRRCDGDSSCRVADGYACRALAGAAHPVCELPEAGAPVDAGATD